MENSQFGEALACRLRAAWRREEGEELWPVAPVPHESRPGPGLFQGGQGATLIVFNSNLMPVPVTPSRPGPETRTRTLRLGPLDPESFPFQGQK